MTDSNCCLSGGCWESGFDLSYKLARERLARMDDLPGQCRKSGAWLVDAKSIVLNYFDEQYRITVPDGEISMEGSNAEVALRDKILILHYFIGAKGTPPTGKLIAYKQLVGGISYFPAFSQRAIAPLVRGCGRNPELLVEAATRLGGHRASQGDVSMIINAFEHVPITLVLWTGDEEVAPNGSILFDANISDYLSTEDVTVLCETPVRKMVKGAHSG
jgi:Domain of unknown function (DUF3786)